MRIVSINVHYQDGLGYQDYYLGRELVRLGHQVDFIASDVHFDFPQYDKTVKDIIGDKKVGVGVFVNDYGCKVHRLKGTNKKYTGWIWLRGFKQKLLELKPDLIIMHGVMNYQAIRLSLLRTKLNCDIVYDDHTTINVLNKSMIARFIFMLYRHTAVRLIERSALMIVGISNTCFEVLTKYYGFQGKSVELIPLGTDTEHFKPSKIKRKKYRKKLEILDNEILIVHTGKIYKEKGSHRIMKVINENKHKFKLQRIVVLFVGTVADEYLSTVEQSIGNLKFIHLAPTNQEELSYIYNAADFCVWPDHTTISTLDASACGCPVICSTIMSERVNSRSGKLVSSGNDEELLAAIELMYSSMQLRQEMGRHARSYIVENFSWRMIARRFIQS